MEIIISTLNLTANTISLDDSIPLPVTLGEGYSIIPNASVRCTVDGVDKLVLFCTREFYDEELDEFTIDTPIFIVTLGDELTISDPIIGEDIILIVNGYKSVVVDSNYITFIGAFVGEINKMGDNFGSIGIKTIKILPNDTIEFGDINEQMKFSINNGFDFFTYLYLQELQIIDDDYLHIIPKYDEKNGTDDSYSLYLGKRIENKVEFFDTIDSTIGIFDTDAGEGDEVDVVVSGIYENENFNLVPGKTYYVDTNGNLTTTKKEIQKKPTADIQEVTYLKIGKSLTNKKMIIDVDSKKEIVSISEKSVA